MDELDPLRSFRDGGPELDEATKARVLARVLDDPVDIRDLQHRSPSSRDHRQDPATDYAVAAPPHGGRRPARWLAAAAAVVVLVGLLAGVLVSRRPSSTEPASAPTTAPVSRLSDIAQRAGEQPDRPLAPGQYAYLRRLAGTHVTAPDGRILDNEELISTWVDVDGAGREDRNSESTTLAPNPERGRFAGLTYDELRALSTDPAVLGPRVRSALGAQDEDQIGSALAVTLSWPSLKPEVRRAAVELLATQGRELGPIRDHSGREGVGLAIPSHFGTTDVLVFDPATGGLLGTYILPTVDQLDLTTATDWTVYVTSEVREEIG